MRLTLKKPERLKSKKLIECLFAEGNQTKVYPIKLIYLQTKHSSNFPVQVAFTVPKKNFRKAVKRSRIKRLLREVYRKEKPMVYNLLNKPYIFMFIFIGNIEPEYTLLEKKMKILLSNFSKQTKTQL